jgi:thymidylate synthase (FAD)
MKLIKPYTEILTPINGEEILKTLEKVARTCYKSEDKIINESAPKLVKALIERGHEAMIEFFDITVKFVCDRGVSHELVRHRIASFAQESTRYCNYSQDKFANEIIFIEPLWLQDTCHKGLEHSLDGKYSDMFTIEDFIDFLTQAESSYLAALVAGWQPQQARNLLPNALKTEINIKMNLREWRHFFGLRCAKAAHPQMRELTIPLLEELKSKIPIIFDDITY